MFVCGLLTMMAGGTAQAAAQKKHTPATKAAARHAAARKPAAPALDQEALKTQGMLGRAGYSPREIDGRMGTSTKRALAAFTKEGGTPETASPPLVTYKITDHAATRPFPPNPAG